MERYKVETIARKTVLLIMIISMFRFKTRLTMGRESVVMFFLEDLAQYQGKISRITMMFLMTMLK